MMRGNNSRNRSRGRNKNSNFQGRGGTKRRKGASTRGRDLREASISGNKRERIAVESGELVLIDQFMLANPQFVDKIIASIDESPEVKEKIINDYGGCVISVEPGTYRIERDPFAFSIVVHPEGYKVDVEQLTDMASDPTGKVFVDTRCLAMIDRELLDDDDLLRRYQETWFMGEEKGCRDLLRDNGGAVRYGFQRYGDELGVFHIKEENVVCLWPAETS